MFVGKNRGNASEGCFRPLDTLILGTSEIGEMMRNCGRRKTLRWVGVRHFRSRTDEHAAWRSRVESLRASDCWRGDTDRFWRPFCADRTDIVSFVFFRTPSLSARVSSRGYRRRSRPLAVRHRTISARERFVHVTARAWFRGEGRGGASVGSQTCTGWVVAVGFLNGCVRVNRRRT